MAEIIIDVNSSLHARSFSENERIHAKAFERVKRIVSTQLEKAKHHKEAAYLKNEEKSDYVRYYNTISILGERGVGKTSFLMSLRKEYEAQGRKAPNDVEHDNEAQGVVGHDNRMCLLPLIDPTLFEEKGHLFLLIVTLIEEQVKAAVKNGVDDDRKHAYERYQKIRTLLAQGLPTLDNEGMTYTEPQWHEDEYMMVRGMESVNAAFNLELNFHRLVNEALKIVQAESFMLMFDDIDVDFKKGWMVLETLRKFLTTPQLVILLSGNMKLYSKNVRKQQWRNFGKELLVNEMELGNAGKLEYTQLVNEIEGQYMQKVLKSENRVFLYSMNENILINGDTFKVKYEEDDNPISLQDAYKDILNANGVTGSSVVGMFTSFFMSTSVRTQVHFLYNMYHGDQNDLMSKVSVFTSRMYAQNIDVDIMVNATQYDIVLLHYLINKELLEEAYQMIPNFESTDVNSALTSFTFVFSQLVKRNPSLIFDYWNRICLVRNNMHYLSYNAENKDYVGKYCAGAGIYQSRDLRSLVGNSMAFLASLHRNFTKHDGCIPLMGFGDVTRGKGRDLDKRIDKVLSQANNLQRVLGYLPLVTLLRDDKNGRSLYYSVYTLLANIGQIVKAEGEEMLKQTVRTACMPVSYQVRTYNMYSSDDTQDVTPDAEINIEDDAISTIANAVSTWKSRYAGLSIAYGNYLFGRIATRVYYSLVNIAENNKNEPLGKVFCLFVTNIINACLIEESKICDNNQLGGININNVSTSAKILADNIRNLNGVVLPFTKWIITCPLLYPYIHPTEYPAIMDYVKECCNNQIFNQELLTTEGCMTTVLDKIACLHQKAKIAFSAGKNVINRTIQQINANQLDVEIIMNGDTQAAKQELDSVFIRVSSRSLTTLRNKCRNNNGVLELRQVEDR